MDISTSTLCNMYNFSKTKNITIDMLREDTALDTLRFSNTTGWIYANEWIQCIRNLKKQTGYSIERLGYEIILNDLSTWQIMYLVLTPITFLCNKNLVEGVSKIKTLTVRKEGDILIATTIPIKNSISSIFNEFNRGAIRAILARKGYKDIQTRILDIENTAYTWGSLTRFSTPELYPEDTATSGVPFTANDFKGVI